LNRVKQRLQFLRPPPRTDLSLQGQHQSSSSSNIYIPIIDLSLPEFSLDALSNINETSILEVDKNVSDDD